SLDVVGLLYRYSRSDYAAAQELAIHGAQFANRPRPRYGFMDYGRLPAANYVLLCPRKHAGLVLGRWRLGLPALTGHLQDQAFSTGVDRFVPVGWTFSGNAVLAESRD